MIRIDHRILIPTPPNFIWDFVSDLNHNSMWQVDCENIVFLSQKQKGVGTRWRQRANNRQETVYEILTWYDGLGYEYIMVDGAVFKSLRGRLRLQEIAEGTIVQWTVDYELGGGMLGTLRNSLGIERRNDNLMRESLKTLWKEAKRSGSMENYQARSLLREGPTSFDERAQYEPRHRSIYQQQFENMPDDNLSTEPATADPIILEPPISDEDTRPRPVVDEQPPVVEPAPTSTVDEPNDLSRFAPPPSQAPEPAVEQPEHKQAPESTKPTRDLIAGKPTPTATDTAEHVATSAPTTEPAEPSSVTPPSPIPEPIAPPSISDGAAGEMSIWEVFGIPSPTDTQKMRAIEAADEAAAEYKAEKNESQSAEVGVAASVSDPPPIPEPSDTTERWSRAGLRNRLRTAQIKVRRPGK